MDLDYLNNYNVFCTYDYKYDSFKNYSMIVKSDFTVKNGEFRDSINCKLNIPSDIVKPNGYFISFNEEIRPLSENMVLLTFKNNLAYPYEIQDIIIQYDLFVMRDPDYINTIVFTSPIKGTIPLYIYKLKTGINKGHIILDYTGEKFDNRTMEFFSIPAIYVFKTPQKYFDVVQDLCIPTNEEKYDIEQCILNIKNNFEPKQLLENPIDIVKSELVVENEDKTKTKPKNIYNYILISIAFVILLIVIIKN